MTYTAPPGSLAVRTGSFFPSETQRETLFFEKAVSSVSATAAKSKVETRFFDASGNLIELDDLGDDSTHAHDVCYTVTYTDEQNTHITRPTLVQANAVLSGAMLRKRTATYAPATGAVLTLTNVVSGGKAPGTGTPYNQASSTFTYTYDAFGNVATFTEPAPSQHQLRYTYDSIARTHRTRVDDVSFGYSSTASYDLRFGALSASTDTNGQPETLTYDTFGRLCTVRGPDDQAPASEATIEMRYSVVPGSCPKALANPVSLPAFASTLHKDVQHASDPIETVTFVDGLGRVIETKKDLQRDPQGDGTRQVGMTVSGAVTFDGRGRVSAQGQPAFAPTPSTAFVVVPMGVNTTTRYDYDEIGRPVTVTAPNLSAGGASDPIVTTTSYSVVSPQNATPANNLGDGSTWLLTTVTDPNGNTRYAYADARGNRMAVREFNVIGAATTPTALTTRYSYDPIDELVTVTDAKGNNTTAAYDTVGRMVTLGSLDAGQTEYRYDLAGNLAEKQTALLRAQSRIIRYNYDHGRLTGITYPSLPAVVYTYGASTETGDANGNVAGRIKRVVMEAGSETRTYDRLGNVNQAQTTLNNMAQANPATVTFGMEYSYDWLGRMLTMTFPNWMENTFNFVPGEGEVVTYNYDAGGNIDQITGHYMTPNPQQTSVPRDYTYLSHMGYDEFEQRTVLVSGNGIANKYLYDGPTRRLAKVNADSFGAQERQAGAPPTPFHRLVYTYDKAGNVLTMVNNVSVQPTRNAGVFVGPLEVTYTYDNLYQLRSLTGRYRPNIGYGYNYSDTYTYDEIGNIKSKAQSQDRRVWSNQTVNPADPNPVVTQLAGSTFDHNVGPLTYSLTYQYPASRPHATTPITETPANTTPSARTYSYDANGNNTGNSFRGNNQVQVWDEENRLKQVDVNGGFRAKFRYDDQGERRKKQTGAGDSWYVNQFFVLLPNNLPTKHIFAGETRIASKTDAISMQTPVVNYYHPDHLGTTSYTSVPNQDLVQHERYFAFGELWRPGAEQEETDLGRADNLRREWTFTSKEWDVDTSLYYFGARYFDPHTDVWQSPDPILAGYMKRGPAGASSRNLGLYTYGWNNPVVMRDPDGRQTIGPDNGGPRMTWREFLGIHEAQQQIGRDLGKGGIGTGLAREVGAAVTDDPRRIQGLTGMVSNAGNILSAAALQTVVKIDGNTGKVTVDKGPAAGGLQFGAPNDAFLSNAAKASPIDGALDVAVHGSSFAVEIGDKAVDHRTLAHLIQGSSEFTGQEIRLLSCSSGACADGFAQNLANKLGVPVTAPNQTIWAFPDGRLTIGPLPDTHTGSFVRFVPGGGK